MPEVGPDLPNENVTLAKGYYTRFSARRPGVFQLTVLTPAWDGQRTLRHIFNPSTQQRPEGTVSACIIRIVRAITVVRCTSEKGGGRLQIYFPTSAEGMPLPKQERVHYARGRTIMLVDDERPSRHRKDS